MSLFTPQELKILSTPGVQTALKILAERFPALTMQAASPAEGTELMPCRNCGSTNLHHYKASREVECNECEECLSQADWQAKRPVEEALRAERDWLAHTLGSINASNDDTDPKLDSKEFWLAAARGATQGSAS